MQISKYQKLTEKEVLKRIKMAKEKLGESLIILGHHYQSDQVIQFADFRGDSLKLAQTVSQETKARYIVFCGVHFMAESAAILSQKDQKVFLPNIEAGCPMANMAEIDQVERVWQELGETTKEIVPVTYINSTAKIKAFCGIHGGIICTSSNAKRVFDWALSQNKKIFFFPDEHLGRNTSLEKGVPKDKIILWDSSKIFGGNSEKAIKSAIIILWKGFCHVHTRFRPEDIDKVRQQHPDIKVIVHPECAEEVVSKSNLSGSTSFIIKTVKESAPKSKWAIGTEINLVGRLVKECPDKLIIPLVWSLCPNMFKTNIYNLCWILESIIKGSSVNQIKVDKSTSKWARVALERMLKLK